jgi:DNA-directed RNA polymerase subunit E'/Rpb7
MNVSKKNTKIKKINKKNNDIYHQSILNKKIVISIKNVDSNLKNTLLELLKINYGDKCNEDGYIIKNTISIISFSTGYINGNNIIFEVVFECTLCLPCEGRIINCKCINITKAGIKAELNDEYNPLIIFIARDHNYLSTKFGEIKENDEIKVRVIGYRFELNDKNISVIAEIYND